jgi:tRNA1(Val) A37 N6-methylase TrmN6
MPRHTNKQLAAFAETGAGQAAVALWLAGDHEAAIAAVSNAAEYADLATHIADNGTVADVVLLLKCSKAMIAMAVPR